MKNPNPENYDFLWSVENTTYFKTSFWLHQEYLKRDFLVTCRGTEWKAWIGKKERKKLSKFGVIFLEKHFGRYKKEVGDKIKEMVSIFRKVHLMDFSYFSDTELRISFLETVKAARSLWRLYFFTEYFLYDEIQRQTEKKSIKNRHLINKIRQMQKLKFKIRLKLNQTYFFKGNIFQKYFEEIKKRRGTFDFYSLNYQEIADLLEGKKIKRVNRENYVWGNFNEWKLILGNRALQIIKSFNKSLLEGVGRKEIKGQVANPGFYRGYTKIIPFDLRKDITKEISKMKKGDILVTGSTGPEMIIACKKAGAIITEEGGICSHAAIVSREVGVPCIIGTKIATQVLKDGDLVEVDANQGIVKIIKKAK